MDTKSWQHMTSEDMLQHAKESLKDPKKLTEEEEIEYDADHGYFDDDD